MLLTRSDIYYSGSARLDGLSHANPPNPPISSEIIKRDSSEFAVGPGLYWFWQAWEFDVSILWVAEPV